MTHGTNRVNGTNSTRRALGKAALAIAREDLQTVIVNRDSLEANVTNAEAAVELARIDLDNTRIVAPRDGRFARGPLA